MDEINDKLINVKRLIQFWKKFRVGESYLKDRNKGEVFNNYTENSADGAYSHAEGHETTASGNYSHSEGFNTEASKEYSHAEGNSTIASGYHLMQKDLTQWLPEYHLTQKVVIQ